MTGRVWSPRSFPHSQCTLAQNGILLSSCVGGTLDPMDRTWRITSRGGGKGGEEDLEQLNDADITPILPPSTSHPSTCPPFSSREEMNEQHERAASIAVFQGQVRRGIASLKEGADIAQQQKDSNRGRNNKLPDNHIMVSCDKWAGLVT